MHVFPLEDGVELLLGITQSISYVTMGIFLSLVYYKTNNKTTDPINNIKDIINIIKGNLLLFSFSLIGLPT